MITQYLKLVGAGSQSNFSFHDDYEGDYEGHHTGHHTGHPADHFSKLAHQCGLNHHGVKVHHDGVTIERDWDDSPEERHALTKVFHNLHKLKAKFPGQDFNTARYSSGSHHHPDHSVNLGFEIENPPAVKHEITIQQGNAHLANQQLDEYKKSTPNHKIPADWKFWNTEDRYLGFGHKQHEGNWRHDNPKGHWTVHKSGQHTTGPGLEKTVAHILEHNPHIEGHHYEGDHLPAHDPRSHFHDDYLERYEGHH